MYFDCVDVFICLFVFQTNVTKLGQPYNNCEDRYSYLEPFDYHYTHQVKNYGVRLCA